MTVGDVAHFDLAPIHGGFDKIDIEYDGKEVFEFTDHRYMFYAVRLDDYRTYMTVRSPKWQTVTLPAARFREFAVPIRKFLFG